MKTLKFSGLNLAFKLFLAAGIFSCTDDPAPVLNRPVQQAQAVTSSMSCFIDDRPWAVDNMGGENSLQIQYIDANKFLTFQGSVHYGNNISRGINIKLQQIDLRNMELNASRFIQINNNELTYSPVTLIVNDASNYEYLSVPVNQSKNYIEFQVVSRTDNLAVLKGTFGFSLARSQNAKPYNIEGGQFEIRVRLDQPIE